MVLTVLFMTLAGVISHALPHSMGISTVGALGMLAAAYLPRAYSLIPVFLTVIIVDAANGFYSTLAMIIVYIAHLTATLSVRPILRLIRIHSIALAAIVSAVVFFLISNLAPMAMGYCQNTLEGWIACYTNALPFLLKGIFANAVFGGLAFGMIAIVGATDAYRVFAAKRD